MVQRPSSNTRQPGSSTIRLGSTRIRPGPTSKSTTIQPRPLPTIWTRWRKDLDAEWEDTDNEWEKTPTESDPLGVPALPEVPLLPEVPALSAVSVSPVSEVYTTYQVRFSALRKECHGTGIKHASNTCRYQYSRQFKLSAISFAKQYAMPGLFADGTVGTPLMMFFFFFFLSHVTPHAA